MPDTGFFSVLFSKKTRACVRVVLRLTRVQCNRPYLRGAVVSL